MKQVCLLFAIYLYCLSAQAHKSPILCGGIPSLLLHKFMFTYSKKISEDMNALKQKFETISSQKSNEMRNIAG